MAYTARVCVLGLLLLAVSTHAARMSVLTKLKTHAAGDASGNTRELVADIATLSAKARDLNDAIKRVKAGEISAVDAEKQVMGGAASASASGQPTGPLGTGEADSRRSPKKASDAYGVPDVARISENLDKVIQAMEQPVQGGSKRVQRYREGELLAVLRGLEVIPPAAGVPNRIKKKPLSRLGDYTKLHYAPDKAGVLHLPYAKVVGDPDGQRTGLDDKQVDMVARIVLSHAHYAKCERKNEYGELVLACDGANDQAEAAKFAAETASKEKQAEAKIAEDKAAEGAIKALASLSSDIITGKSESSSSSSSSGRSASGNGGTEKTQSKGSAAASGASGSASAASVSSTQQNGSAPAHDFYG